MLRGKGAWLRYGLVGAGLALAFAGAAMAGIAVHSAARATRVSVTEREYRLTVKTTLKSGKTTFVVTNRGTIGHSLALSGPGIAKKRIAGLVAPGKTKTLTVTLKPGTYHIWCPVPGHAGLGMKATLHVAGGSSSGSGAGSTTTTSGGGGWG